MAKTETGQYFTLTGKMSRKELRSLRDTISFFCPQCDGNVILKAGDIVIPHFAHRKDNNCTTLFSEGESTEHLLGKQQLYDFFMAFPDVEVKMEPYFQQLAQRPDLLVNINSNVVPIEFQCSPIPAARMKARTAGYRSFGMEPIWLMQTPKKLKQLPQGINVYSLSYFEENFLNYSHPEGMVFLTYNPHSKKFHYFTSLLHIAGRQFIGSHRILSIENQYFPFVRPKPLTIEQLNIYCMLYSSQRKKYLRSRIYYNREGVRNAFLRQCYELRIIPSELPIWIGVPVTFYNGINRHPCDWQLSFVHFLISKGIDLSQIHEREIFDYIEQENLPYKEGAEMCRKYIKFLSSLGIGSLKQHLQFSEIPQFEILLSEYLQSEMELEKI